MPFILSLFIGRVVGPSLIVPGVFSVPVLCIFLVFMPQMIFEFKNSSILKRIGATPIKPIKFLSALGLYCSIITVTAFIFLLCSCFVIFCDSLENKTISFINTNNISGVDMSLSPFQVPTFMHLIKNGN